MTSIMESMFDSTYDSSFYGFTSQDIYNNDIFEVIRNKKSYTLRSKDEVDFMKFQNYMSGQYHQYSDKKQNGIIYKCQSTSSELPVTITLYPSTSAVHVQGMGSAEWLHELAKVSQLILHQDSSILQSTPLRSRPSPIFIPDVSMINHQPHPPLSAPSFGTNFLLPHNAQEINPVNSHSCIKETHTVEIQCNPNTAEVGTQTGEPLYKEMTSIKLANVDLSKNNKELKTKIENLTEAYTQLASSYSEIINRLDLVTAERDSLQTQLDETFIQPKASSNTRIKSPRPPTPAPKRPPPPPPPPPPIHLSNSFGALEMETLPVQPQPTVPPAPNMAPVTPPPKTPKAHSRSQQHRDLPQREHASASPQIVIFSNSMCSRINSQRFYRGRTTKIFAKSGAAIPDVQRLVEDYNLDEPKYVILQAWTNSATRNMSETCEQQASSLVNTTLQKFPNAHIIISSGLPRLIPINIRNTNVGIAKLNRTLESKWRSNSRVTFADHTSTFVNDYDGHIYNDLYYDRVHLNSRGLGKLVLNLRRAIDSVSPFPNINHHQPNR